MLYEQKILLSEEEVSELLSRCNKWSPSLLVDPSTNIPEVKSKLRVSETYHMPVCKGDWFYSKLYDLFLEHNIEITVDKFNVMFYKYSKGGFIYKHSDTIASNAFRTLVGILFLGGNYTGGDFVIYDNKNNPTIVEQEPGSVAIYSPNAPHEVTEVTSGIRYSAAIFIHKHQCRFLNQSVI